VGVGEEERSRRRLTPIRGRAPSAAISDDAGIIGRALRTFDALAATDPSGRLAPARAALLGDDYLVSGSSVTST
jgi:hypothetical protein